MCNTKKITDCHSRYSTRNIILDMINDRIGYTHIRIGYTHDRIGYTHDTIGFTHDTIGYMVNLIHANNDKRSSR
jgi:hypothetical protein